MDQEVELTAAKHRKIVHRSFDGADCKAAFLSNLAIEFEHGGAEIDNRYIRACSGVDWSLATAASSEAEDIPALNVATEPSGAIDACERISKVVVAGRLGEPMPRFG
jgi:hypothetical protein